MERWEGRVALVTGASSAGIGQAVASSLVKLGMKVIGCGRNLDRLQELAEKLNSDVSCKGSFTAIQCDLRQEEQILAMFEQVKQQHAGVDVCVNCAGLGHNAPLLTGSMEQWRDMVDVNMLGLLVCARETVRSMQERNVDDGHIINISAMSGYRLSGGKSLNFYGATKAAVLILTDGLRQELREIKSHIRVTQISPGLTETEFFSRKSGAELSQHLFSSLKCLQPGDLADCVVYILSAPPHVQVQDILIRPTEECPPGTPR